MEENKKFYMSKSRMGTYESCPLSYKFSYIDKHQTGNQATEIGTDVHDFIEEIFEVIKPQSDGTFQDIGKLKLFPNTKYKQNVLLFEQERWKSICEKGLDESYFFPVYCEDKYRDEENELVGIVDRVHKCHKDDKFVCELEGFNDGDLVIVENKSGSYSKQKSINYEEELLWYRMLIKKNFNIDIRWACIYFPFTNRVHYIDLNAPKFNIEELQQRIKFVRENIISGYFPPEPSWKCKMCFHKNNCDFGK